MMILSFGPEDGSVEGKLGLMPKKEQCKLWSPTGMGMGIQGMDFKVHRYIMQGRLSRAMTEAQRNGFGSTEEDVPTPS